MDEVEHLSAGIVPNFIRHVKSLKFEAMGDIGEIPANDSQPEEREGAFRLSKGQALIGVGILLGVRKKQAQKRSSFVSVQAQDIALQLERALERESEGGQGNGKRQRIDNRWKQNARCLKPRTVLLVASLDVCDDFAELIDESDSTTNSDPAVLDTGITTKEQPLVGAPPCALGTLGSQKCQRCLVDSSRTVLKCTWCNSTS
eukprot:CAMPEP_0198152850 /NCGR_PEP_ID=MMETSP1443-20131203/61519_1 /TAXON_ID=186043 /ORGANISM="Entomoneis sp., Strain CCMP2396" /LENGTH=201 /DNA_ID=CAMNT_0043818983 /DNA_START=305 /DNA_END=906 /DNA_ORIENTATION=+